MTEYFIIACATAVITVFLYYYFLAIYDFWMVRGVAGPKPIPLFGNLKDVVFEKKSMIELLTDLYKQYKDRGMFGIFILREPVLVLTDPDEIKNVLIKDFSNFTDKGVVISETWDPLSPHIFNLEPRRWRPIRSRLAPNFSSGRLKDMFGMIFECSNLLEKMVANVAEKGEPIEIRILAMRYTIDVIATCAFGIEVNSLTEENTEFLKMSKLVFEPSAAGATKFRLQQYMPIGYKLLAAFLEQKEITTFFTNLTLDTIRHRRENKIYRNDFINTLLELQDHPEKLGDVELTDKLTVAQAFIFYLAGFETSSTTMTYALYELALNQDVQSKLREEIKEVYRNKNSNLEYTTVKEMEYLDAVFQETLRKHPAIPYLRRKSENSYTFARTKVTIPKAQNLLIPIYAIQNDPNIYPNPDVFDPERFRGPHKNTRHPMHFLPFSDGPRNCMGARFATHQSKVGLIRILRNHKVDVCDKTEVHCAIHPRSFVLTPLEPIYLTLSKCD